MLSTAHKCSAIVKEPIKTALAYVGISVMLSSPKDDNDSDIFVLNNKVVFFVVKARKV